MTQSIKTAMEPSQKQMTNTQKKDWGEDECPKCHSTMFWHDCWNCENGFSHHNCGEDSCCCVDPIPNVVCDVCEGNGGWFSCPSCTTIEKEETI